MTPTRTHKLLGRRAWPVWLALCAAAACAPQAGARRPTAGPNARATQPAAPRPTPVYESPVLAGLVAAAVERTNHEVRYDGSYYQIAYPGGDVPADRGACTDEVVRAYRAVGVDLQKEVHEDMAANFAAYPRTFQLARPDPNIDHRRVPNLMTFFARKGKPLPTTTDPAAYQPGDIVTWVLNGGLTHIGLVVDVPSDEDPARYQIMHNIGAGPKIEDALFAWPVTGHYRYTGPPPPPKPTPRARRAVQRSPAPRVQG
ncbi:MAG TPA: DUF1287 domain-containing protein [Pyrinomonadaceae bacterium]|jgi:hypothetical protein